MSSIRGLLFGLVVVTAGFTAAADADDYGVLGETFEIVEPDLLEWIASRLRAAHADGTLDTMNEAFARRVEGTVNRPPPVLHIVDATQTRSWLYDPSITVPQDYADHRGVVFAHQGDHVNPLELVALRKRYVFIDGDNADQVAWALDQYEQVSGQISIILTNGAPLDLMTQHQVRFFFDQTGFLTERLGITAVPASMDQEGGLVRLIEHGPEEWASLSGDEG